MQLDPDELVEQTRCNLRKGFRAIKIKVGREKLSEDVARVRAVRECIGPDTPLMIDANMRYSVEQAISAARKFRDFDVYWFEEPTIPDDYKGMARIATEGGLPDSGRRKPAHDLRIPSYDRRRQNRFPGAGCFQYRRHYQLDAGGQARLCP